MLIAVTGAQGSIGRAVVHELTSANHHVRALDRTTPPQEQSQNVESHQLDVCDFDQLHDAVRGTDAIVHLAGIPHPLHDPGHLVHTTNVTASYNALAAAAQNGIDKICLASSINAIGGAFSRHAHYDYFPVDEQHPTYNEDPYSLSKWIVEQQADSFARAHPHMTLSSLRLHGATPDRATAAARVPDADQTMLINHLWGYVRTDDAARACHLALQGDWHGHEVFNIVAPDTVMDTDSRDLARQHWPATTLRQSLAANSGFYDCTKAKRILGWTHTPR